MSDTGFVLGRNPDQVVSPDVAFVRSDRLDPSRNRRGILPMSRRTSRSRSSRPATIRCSFSARSTSTWPRKCRCSGSSIQSSGWCGSTGPVSTRWILGDDVLDASDVVPGFSMTVSEIFA